MWWWWGGSYQGDTISKPKIAFLVLKRLRRKRWTFGEARMRKRRGRIVHLERRDSILLATVDASAYRGNSGGARLILGMRGLRLEMTPASSCLSIIGRYLGGA